MTLRTGDLAQFERTTANMLSVQSRMRRDNLHIASGKSVHRYTDLAERSSVLIRAQAAVAETRTFADQNELLVNRINLMDGALSDIKDVASELQTLLVARRNPTTGDSIPLDLEAAGMRDRLVGRLNLQVDGRYVFGGSRTDTPPVQASAITSDPTDTSYYQGDHIPLQARIDVSLQSEYGVLADEEPFAKLFAALELAAEGHAPTDETVLLQAATLAEEALAGVIARRGELGAAAARIDGIRDSQEGTLLYLEEQVSQLIDTDVPTTMARISQDQVSLEGSFAVTAQLSRLNLTDYLR